MNQKIRIISGQWRGRKIQFSNAPHLRPTTDRMREMLFNWLQTQVNGSRCLDLFSGSGALVWEALSRGGKVATLIDSNKSVVRDLKKTAELLGCQSSVSIYQANAVQWLKNYQQHSSGQQYDLVFLDPPFKQNFLQPCIQLVIEQGLLAEGGYLYLESGNGQELDQKPCEESFHEALTLVKSKRLGGVTAQLLIRQ